MNDTQLTIEQSLTQGFKTGIKNAFQEANFDKTYTAVVKKLIDKVTGQYQLKYQDATITAYYYGNGTFLEGDQVFINVPRNDFSSQIIIIGGIPGNGSTYIPIIDYNQNFNSEGPNVWESSQVFELNSYKDNEIVIYKVAEDQSQGINLNNINIDSVERYIKNGDGLVLGFITQTIYNETQSAGYFGMEIDVEFQNKNGEGAAVRPYIVSNANTIGNPNRFIKPTTIQTFIKTIEPQDFIRIKEIKLFNNSFLLSDENKENTDIRIYGIQIRGGKALTAQESTSSILHIDYSTNGNTLGAVVGSDEKKIDSILLKAQLKVKGVELNPDPSVNDISYYWFRQNGLVFKGTDKYNIIGGQGWECLNPKTSEKGSFIPFKVNTFIFTSQLIDENNIEGIGNKASVLSKSTLIKCVAIYKDINQSNQTTIYDLNKAQLSLLSSDRIIKTIQVKDEEGNVIVPEVSQNRTTYYLDQGSPNLQCIVENDTYGQGTYHFQWVEIPEFGSAKEIKQNDDNIDYKQASKKYKEAQRKAKQVESSKRNDYIHHSKSYIQAEQDWEKVQQPRVQNDIYYNVPIKNIANSSKIICYVTKTVNDNTYILGSASITLYNISAIGGAYSLILENASQIFQYDEKGNSPYTNDKDRVDEYPPTLTFKLFDDASNEVPYSQIIQNGYVAWCIPGQNTLLKSRSTADRMINYNDTLVNSTDIALAASLYNVYYNISSFDYSLVDNFNKDYVNNEIKLVVKYKDIQLQAYTDFIFPKDGDLGTNGTDIIAKAYPTIDGTTPAYTDRLYISIAPGETSSSTITTNYDDNGSLINKLNFQLYNNNTKVTGVTHPTWSTPPKVSINNSNNVEAGTGISLLQLSSSTSNNSVTIDGVKNISTPPSSTGLSTAINYIKNNNIVDIIRGQYKYNWATSESDLNYFAEYPINFVYLVNNLYRIKLVQKTGFKYVKYTQDGTNPDYDNTKSFEIFVQRKNINIEDDLIYYSSQGQEIVTVNWTAIGNIQILQQNKEKCLAKPKDTFSGDKLNSALIAQVSIKDYISNSSNPQTQKIGFIHIPIYMYLNRYGRSAINDWDGNKIDLGTNGMILSPQVGAGKKESDNSFTGVLIGDLVNSDNKTETGLIGLHEGKRSIFLDAETGKAQFGKQGAAKIVLNPSQKMNNKDVAFLYSDGFKKDLYKQNNGASKKDNTYGQGLMIDLTSPAIQFGSGNFYVDSSGNIHAGGNGDIAGWTVSNDALYKHDGTNKTGMRSGSDPAFYAGTKTQDSIKPTDSNVYNFFVNHNGYLFSKSGEIAGWAITENSLSKNGTGMSSNDSKSTNKAFYAGNNFYVTHGGNLYAKTGTIGPWTLTEDKFSNGLMNIGQHTITEKNMNTSFGDNTVSGNRQARIWSYQSNHSGDDKYLNFVLSSSGMLYAKSGTIGGWTLSTSDLKKETTEGNIGIDSKNCMIYGGKGANSASNTWQIQANGKATFKNIDATGGTVGGWIITKNTLKSEATVDGKENSDPLIELNSEKGSITAKKGHIGNVKITADGLEGTWGYIQPDSVQLKGLKVGNDGNVTSSGGGGGISGTGMGMKGGSSYVNPNSVTTTQNGKQTLAEFINLKVDNLDVMKKLKYNGRSAIWKQIHSIKGIAINNNKIVITYELIPAIVASASNGYGTNTVSCDLPQ